MELEASERQVEVVASVESENLQLVVDLVEWDEEPLALQLLEEPSLAFEILEPVVEEFEQGLEPVVLAVEQALEVVASLFLLPFLSLL